MTVARKDIFDNYRTICSRYSQIYTRCMQLVSNIPMTKEAISELHVLTATLKHLETLQVNVNSVVSFLETVSKNSIPGAAINLGRGQGHTLGISKFLLKNLSKRILVLTENPQSFGSNIPTNFTITSDAARARGQQFDLIILDSMKTSLCRSTDGLIVKVGDSDYNFKFFK